MPTVHVDHEAMEEIIPQEAVDGGHLRDHFVDGDVEAFHLEASDRRMPASAGADTLTVSPDAVMIDGRRPSIVTAPCDPLDEPGAQDGQGGAA